MGISAANFLAIKGADDVVAAKRCKSLAGHICSARFFLKYQVHGLNP
jgi:hypothetical protein